MSCITYTPPASSGGSQNLQQVTDIGNTTTKAIVSANAGASTSMNGGIFSINNGTAVLTQVVAAGAGSFSAQWRPLSGVPAYLSDIPVTSGFVPYTGANADVALGGNTFQSRGIEVTLPNSIQVPNPDYAEFGGTYIADYGFGGNTGLWLGNVIPNASNFAIIGNGSQTFFNAGSQLVFSINNVAGVQVAQGSQSSDTLAVTGSISAAGPSYPITTVSANYSIGNNEYSLLVDCTAGPVAVLLPGMATPFPHGRICVIKKIAGIPANAVIVNSSGTIKIDGAGTQTITVVNDSLTLQWDGANYWIIK